MGALMVVVGGVGLLLIFNYWNKKEAKSKEIGEEFNIENHKFSNILGTILFLVLLIGLVIANVQECAH